MPFAPPSLQRAISLATLAIVAFAFSGCASREERIQEIQSEANSALFINDSTKAINLLRKGLAKYPDSNELRIALSRAVQNSGNLKEAVSLLKEAVEQNPEADQLWVKIGELHASLGEGEAAILAFEVFLKNHGGDFLAWKTVALENEKLGKLTDAIKAASRWNDLTPSSQPALKLGELYLASRNIPQARSWFSQAAAYADNGAAKDALAELIKLETGLKQFQQATIWVSQFAQRYPNDLADPRVRESKIVLDNWERARREIADAAAALEHERDDLEAKRLAEERAAAEKKSEELSQALANQQPETAAETQVATREKAPVALLGDTEPTVLPKPSTSPTTSKPANDALPLSPYETATAAFEEGRYDEAIPLYWEILGENSNDAQIWYRLSRSYYQQQSWYDAESTILEAKRRAPRSEVIAQQYLLTIRNTQAITSVLEEIKALRLLFPRSPTIALILAQSLRDARAPRNIVAAAYSDFLSLAPPGEPGYEEANQYLQNAN